MKPKAIYAGSFDPITDNAMGSGTTGVAALNLGRRFVGMEMDNDWFEKARLRLSGCCK
jgi:DNA modification methylase